MFTRAVLPLLTAGLLAACANCPDPGTHANADKAAANKTATEAMWKAWNDRDFTALEASMAENFITHNPDPSWGGNGRKEMMEGSKKMLEMMPDMKGEIITMTADGDWVTVVSKMTGTNTNGMGPGMPATGKSFDVIGIDLMRFESGKAVEHYGVIDAMTMMGQLGLMGGEDMAEKEHVCNPGCKGDQHNILHGEKGHVCAPDCPGMQAEASAATKG
jgi:predicted ester cyclase